ncbi:pol polyprotein, partial [Pseudoloma neurophilia]
PALPNSLCSNMASTANYNIKTFSGDDNEDIILWLKELHMCSQLFRWDNEYEKQILIIHLKGEARSWAAEYLSDHNFNVDLITFVAELRKRFESKGRDDFNLTNFIHMSPPKNREEFKKILRSATLLAEKGLMSFEALCQLIIKKVPEAFKAILVHTMENANTWQEFAHRADSTCWVAFPDHVFNAISCESKGQAGIQKQEIENCLLHGLSTHKTEQCFRILAFIKKEKIKDEKRKRDRFIKNRNKNVNQLSMEDEEANKSDLVYSVSSLSVGTSPFLLNGQILGHNYTFLIDTGADVSVLSTNLHMPVDQTNKHNMIIRSACGTSLKTENRTQKLNVLINGYKFSMNPLIVDTDLKFIIIGADVINKHPQILYECLNKINQTSHDIRNVIATNEIDIEFPEYKNLFQEDVNNSPCKEVQHHIDLERAKPIFCKPIRTPIHYESKIDDMIKQLLEKGIIKQSKSPWNSHVRIVPKKNGKLRMCLDYRPLNAETKKDKYPIPRIDEILDSLNGAEIFSTLDATSGYYQIKMSENSSPFTAFSWKRGHYEFNRMPFGLCNAPATFQRYMDTLFKGMEHFVLPYLDDLIIFSKTREEHVKHIKEVFNVLSKAQVVLNKSKCQFFRKELIILGNRISKGSVSPDPSKIKTIQAHKLPTTIQELRSFLGLVNFCREYLPRLSEVANPLFALLKGKTQKSKAQITHSLKSKDAFTQIKEMITSDLSKSQPDLQKPFILTTDASEIGIGAILAQRDSQGRLKMVSAFSKTLDPAQKNYSVTDKELLAIVKSLEHFRHFLLGKEFILRTDHRALTYLHTCKNPTSRLLRWSLRLQEFQFKIEYISGEKNSADSLSRLMHIKKVSQKENLSKDHVKSILDEYHHILGHGSSSNMIFAIRKRYFWFSMVDDIKDYVSRCKICLKGGFARINSKNLFIKTSKPNQLWEIDLLGKIRYKNQFRFIFVAVDHFTKYVETKVIKTKTSKDIKEAISSLIVNKHGKPETILSDCGLEFTSKEIEKFLKDLQIKHETGSPYHHQTTGCVERVNGTLMNKLKKICKFKQEKWQECVEKATLAVNLSFHRGIGTSPFIMQFKRLPELPIDRKLGKGRVFINEKFLYQKRAFIQEKYEKEIVKGTKEVKNDFKLGEKVLIYRKNSNKLASNWITGFHIIRVFNESVLV